VTWHPGGDYILFAGHDPYIYTYRVSDIFQYKNDRIRIASKVWAGDHAEYIDFSKSGSHLVSAHQNGLIKLWVWMGEDPGLNDKRHKGVKKIQSEAMSGDNN
jgi:WD40 repeat protein